MRRSWQGVFIGVDPHKLSATIEVVDEKETILATGRLPTDKAGYVVMRKHVVSHPRRVWAVEGSNGAGRSQIPIHHLSSPPNTVPREVRHRHVQVGVRCPQAGSATPPRLAGLQPA